MELKKVKLEQLALRITELREGLRGRAALVAAQPDQLQFFEEKELVRLQAQVSRQHYPLSAQRKKNRKEPPMSEESSNKKLISGGSQAVITQYLHDFGKKFNPDVTDFDQVHQESLRKTCAGRSFNCPAVSRSTH